MLSRILQLLDTSPPQNSISGFVLFLAHYDSSTVRATRSLNHIHKSGRLWQIHMIWMRIYQTSKSEYLLVQMQLY